MSLIQYFHTNTGLPINKWTHYLPLYERYFSPFRDKNTLFLEIGTGQGGSSRMWQHYFGPSAQIVSIDIREECHQFENDQIKIRVGDQSDPAFLQAIVDEFGPPDIVLDDGSHIMQHVKATFQYSFPRINREALYFVEDMHTAYWPAYGGKLRQPGTFIEDMKEMVDEINADNPHHDRMNAGLMPRSNISSMVRGIFFHQSIVVIEKGPFIDKRERCIPLVPDQTIW